MFKKKEGRKTGRLEGRDGGREERRKGGREGGITEKTIKITHKCLSNVKDFCLILFKCSVLSVAS